MIKFKRQIRSALLISILPLFLTACRSGTGRSENYGAGAETIKGEISDWKKSDQAAAQSTEQHDMSEEEESRFPEDDYILPDSASRLYSQKELEMLSLEQCRLARNEIYARHGYRFKDIALQTYFQNKTWYQGTVEPDRFDDSQLNQTERDNLSLLLHLEQNTKRKTSEDYDQRDINAVNAMIANNGLFAEKDDPTSWDFVTWNTGSIPKRIDRLDLSDKELTGQLDVSGTALTVLICNDNQLTELKGLSGLSGLEGLYCTGNRLKTLDVSGTSLTVLNCSDNQLSELNGVTGLSGLQTLFCYGNQLKTLDVSGTSLTMLYCNYNQLTELKGISDLAGLRTLKCAENQLKTLDVSGTALAFLDCPVNQLTELKGVSGLSSLQTLHCYMNQLKTLDVSGTALTELLCNNNQLSELTGLSGLSGLQILYCANNQLKALDVSGTSLAKLSCVNNQLAALDLSGLMKLTFLACSNNPYRTFKTRNAELTVNIGEGGMVVMTDFFLESHIVKLTATPDANYSFQSWTGLPGGASNTADTSFPLTTDMNVSAAFVGS